MKLWFVLLLPLIPCNAERSRIIGGDLAAAGEYPFQAAIYKTTSDGSFFCGGALITRQWILTAGQCVDGAVSFTIYLGTTDIKTPSSTALKLEASEYILHPDYNPETLDSDVGLIHLRMNVTYTDYIDYIKVIPWRIQDDNPLLGTAGWGQTSDEIGQLQDKLHWVNLTAISNQECKITYGDQITDNMICVVGPFNEGICQGDIGSPLFLRSVYLMHAGIASFVSGNGCESPDPSGFTRIHPYTDWIMEVTDY